MVNDTFVTNITFIYFHIWTYDIRTNILIFIYIYIITAFV